MREGGPVFRIHHGRNGVKLTVRTLSVWLTTFLLLASIDLVQGQRLHDEARDKEAQKAAQLAGEITSKSSFDKQLKNLDTMSNMHLTSIRGREASDGIGYQKSQDVGRRASID